jgi:magnesium transporter
MKPALTKAALSNPVTAQMHQDFTRLFLRQTVGEALQWLRAHPPPGAIIYFYVVDEANRLVGVVPTRRLVLSPPEQAIADLMVRKVVALPHQATVLEACEFFIQHRLLALPVVDDQHHLLGLVDLELYTRVLGEGHQDAELSQLGEAQKRDTLFQLIGVHVANARVTSPLAAFRSRFPWLGCNLAAGILCALLCGIFEADLQRAVALSFFIPVVLNLAESVSSQSVSLTLELLHGERPTWGSMLRKLRAELLTGLCLGLASGVIVGGVALVWLGHWRIALSLLAGIGGGVTAAALLGIGMPTALHLLRLEPRVAAGPVALAGSDVVTLVLYLNVARWLLA